jgi:hypothetical protein
MNVQIYPKLHFKTLLRSRENLTREHGETLPMQEQFSGSIPLRGERPAADILAERLAEHDPANAAPLFIP